MKRGIATFAKRTSRTYSTRSVTSREFRGVFPPITTPFKDDAKQSIDFEAYKKNVKFYSQKSNKLSGLVVLGSNGEFPMLSLDEKLQVFKSCHNTVYVDEKRDEEFKLIAGTGSCSTSETTFLTQEAAKIGYSAAMIVTPFYFTSKMNDDLLYNHYKTIADAVDPFPLILYNVPPFAGNIQISLKVVNKLLATTKNVVGIKDTSGNITYITQLCQLRDKLVQEDPKRNFSVLAGSASYFLPSLVCGADGAVMAFADLFPKELSHLYETYKSATNNTNKNDQHLTHFVLSRSMQSAIVELNQMLSENPSSGLKRALDARGKVYGGSPRLPLLPVSSQDGEKIGQLVAQVENRMKELNVN